MRPTVKICGLMRAQDVEMCARQGADIIGFVVDYPRPVPWNLSAESACELMRLVAKPAQTCIVTGGSADKIIALALQTKPDYIQLHCGETLEDTAHICIALRGQGIKVIKALFPDTPSLEQAARQFSATGIHALLLDPRTPDNATGSGHTADFAVYSQVRSAASCPVILAGGITPANVAEAITRTGAPTIDLMTGVERAPGIKDEAKVAALFRAMRYLAGQS